MDDKFAIIYDEIRKEKKIKETPNALTYLSVLLSNQLTCVTKIILNKEDIEMKFKEYVEILQKVDHPTIIQFVGFCTSSQNIMKQNIIINKYAPYFSLQQIFDEPNKEEKLPWWDRVRKFIIIYGVAQGMKYLHKLQIEHQRLTPSNILIDENIEPRITDFKLSLIYPEFDFSLQNIINSKLFYYIDPYTLNNNGKITAKSDIYSFAIITIQILTGNVQIYEKEDDLENLILEIKKGLLPMVPTEFPPKLRDLLFSCLNIDHNLRPTFTDICSELDEIIQLLPDISTKIFNEYKEKITKQKDEMNAEIRQMKNMADQNDVEAISHEIFKTCKKMGYKPAETQLSLLKNNDGSIANSTSYDILKDNSEENLYQQYHQNNYNDDENHLSDNENNKILTCTIDDLICDNEGDDNFDIKILNEISQKFIDINKDEFLEKIEKQRNLIEKQNFILTDGSIKRLNDLYNYIKAGIPVLLEGPTGTSKTLSAEIVCKLLNRELIRFNLSSETKTSDLIGRYVGDSNSWAGISQQDGPFSQAFRLGKILLLDEINLASPSVLQCIEESLDSEVLSIEIPGKIFERIPMHPDFRVIATQNPNKGSYARKRQNLGLKFYSRFQNINFPAFSEEELLSIGKGLAEKFGYKNLNVIEALVKFHKTWSENKLIIDDPQCFTIREIAATVKALSLGKKVYDTIMIIYGARYKKDIKEEMIKVLNNFNCLLCDKNQSKLMSSKRVANFKGCYANDSLKVTVNSTFFSLKNGRNVIITGQEGCGKTQIALWISEHYNSKLNSNDNSDKSFFCFCTEEIKVADLIGHQAPSGKSDGTSELIKWQDGFLTKAVKYGKCCVLESIDEAPATVTERLNALLDQKYDNQVKYFDIPENSANPFIPIKESFRIIATANIDKISQMSPAFLNRFDIIVLENQIDNITPDKFKNELIAPLLDKYCSDLKPKVSTDSNPEIKKKLINEFSFLKFNFGSNKQKSDAKPKQQNKPPDQEKYSYSKTLIPKIYEKIKDEKNISNISRICKSILKLSYTFQNNSKINEQDIVDFGFALIHDSKQCAVPKEIENHLLNDFQNKDDDTTDDPFFYTGSPSLCSLLAKLAAYSIIEQPVCLTGPTGAGKTSAARTFARIRRRSSTFKSGFQMHSFHSSTRVSHFFGSTTLLDGKIVFHDGTLTKSLKLGLVFIADEFNLSSQQVMKSLALALDPTIGKSVFIPGVGEIINISPEFHFIACQNELGTLGRNAIPDSIAQRFAYIDYPDPKPIDIEEICISISRQNFPKNAKHTEAEEKIARLIANYMLNLNYKKLISIPQWSLRDITKLFRRIYPQNKTKKFKNINYIHHILFYTMSVVFPDDAEAVINEIRTILKSSFKINDKEVDKYIKCYMAIPEIKKEEDQSFYLMKGNSGIPISRIHESIVNKYLPSLWDAIFKVYLSDEREPILLMGNSGYKTFLAKYFLKNAQIISLNQETNVAQLLGKSAFMKIADAKMFYIDYICKIIRNNELEVQIRKEWENGDLNKDKILSLVTQAKRGKIPYSFHYALDHLTNKLLSDQLENRDCTLSDTTLEFRPGLFLNSILQGQSLILKDLSNLPTIVLERFNELFSGKQNITLLEDIHNTFTPADLKELTNFCDSFRVFGTCPANSPTRLSEAVLSRFSVIAVSEYSSKQNLMDNNEIQESLSEQEYVLESYIQINKLHFNPLDIKKLRLFSLSYSTYLKNHITFSQLIKIIEITSKLNQKTSMDIQKLNIGITLYRVLGGIIESKDKKIELFNQIHNYFDIRDIYKDNDDNKSPLSIISKDGIVGVESNFSNLFYKCVTAHECNKQYVAFTKSFNDLLDLIHMGLTIHNPIILEGPPGQGKHTAINYLADMLDIEVVQIVISQNTKVEDLFGKDIISRQKNVSSVKKDGIQIGMVDTEFIRIIKSTENIGKRSLIILENINYASSALLNALAPVFNSNSSTILMPNGSIITKGKFDIIAIFNTQQYSSSKDKLPSSLLNSSIYHIVPKLDENEVKIIIYIKFLLAKLEEKEADQFYECYKKAKSILSKDLSSSEVYTLNDIDKYVLLRTLTQKFFDDEKTILQIV